MTVRAIPAVVCALAGLLGCSGYRESRALSDVRSVVLAQGAYAGFNGGYNDTLACVADAFRCIPGKAAVPWPAFDGAVKASDIAPAARHGYVFRFVAGPRPASPAAQVSPSSITSFAYVATPTSSSGRAFCGDSTGVVCTGDADTLRIVATARCPGMHHYSSHSLPTCE